MTERSRWALWALLGVTLFIVGPLAAYSVGWKVENAIYWVTGVVIFVYTVETQAMRRAMVRANVMQVQPVLITRLDVPPVGGGTGQRLWLSNAGKGTALRIAVEGIDIEVDGRERGPLRFAVRFVTVDVLPSGGDALIEAQLSRVGGATISDFIAHLTPGYANRDFQIIIRCEDIDGRPYASKMSMGKNGTRLVSLRSGR